MARRIYKQLTREVIGSVSRRGLLLSILGTLMLFFLVNVAAKWYLQNYTTNRGYWLVRQKWEKLLNLKQPVDWLILGDSSCNQGVDPEVFNEKLGVTSINLCTVGHVLALNDAWMIDKYIQQFGSPRGVVIVHVYDVWHRDANPSYLAKYPLDWGYWQQMEPPLELSFADVIRLFLGRYFPLYTENKTLSDLLKSPRELIMRSNPFRLQENGFMILPGLTSKKVSKNAETHLQFVRAERELQLSESNQEALDEIAVLAEKYGFDVYLANGPIYDNLYKNKDLQAYYGQVQKMLRAYAAKSDRVHYILQEPMTFSMYQMENADHLIDPAAKETYTNRIASEIISVQKAEH